MNELVLNPKTIVADLQAMKPQIEQALPRHMNPERMARIALTEIRKNPQLLSCSRESFFGSLIAASQLGLEPGINGQCYLIPYKGVCTLVPGWKGYIDLVSRAERASAWTGAVRGDDDFSYTLGSNPHLNHRPGDEDTGDFTHVYAVGWIKGAQWPIIEVASRAKVLAHLKRYNKVGERHYALTNENNLEMYGRKIVLLQVVKYLPQSIELTQAASLDISATENKQRLTIEGVLAGDIDTGSTEDAQKAAEVEQLMEQLGWDQKKRNGCRDMYEGRIDEMHKYLQGEAEKAGKRSAKPNGNGNGHTAKPAPAEKPSPEQTYVPTPDTQVNHAPADFNF